MGSGGGCDAVADEDGDRGCGLRVGVARLERHDHYGVVPFTGSEVDRSESDVPPGPVQFRDRLRLHAEQVLGDE